MEERNRFDILILNARPAAGKSEIIDYLKKCPLNERIERFKIGEFEEIDDFPILWNWFEEDDLLQKMGKPRLHSDEDGYFKEKYFWHLLIQQMSFEYHKRLTRLPDYHQEFTTIIEFSRGSEHGGYREAYTHLSREIVQRMAVLYIDVSYEESLRKNRARFNPLRPDSILEHGLPDKKMEKLYKEVDWHEISTFDAGYLAVQGIRVPFVVFENEDDVTTARGDALGERLELKLNHLWRLWLAR